MGRPAYKLYTKKENLNQMVLNKRDPILDTKRNLASTPKGLFRMTHMIAKWAILNVI